MPRLPGQLGDRARRGAYRARVRPGRLAAFGRDSVIVPPASILAPHRIEIGERTLVLAGATFSVVEEHWGRRYEPRLRIGDGVVIGPRAWFSCVGEIEVEDDVLIGPGALISDSFHDHRGEGVPVLRAPMGAPLPVRIGRGAMVGAGAGVLPGASLGAGSMLLAGAWLAGDLPARSVAAGNPAEVIRRWDPGSGTWEDSSDPRWRELLAALERSLPRPA